MIAHSKKRRAGLLAGAVLVTTLSACSSDGGNAGGEGDGDYTVGVANFTLSGPYFNGMDRAIKEQAKKKGVEIRSTDAGGDAAKLASNVEDLLSKGVDAVIISGGPLESAPAVLNAIKAAGKPAVLVDRKFKTGEYTSWIGPDNEAIGKQNGEFLAGQLPDAATVAIVKGGPADNSIGLARTNGVKSALTGAGLKIVEAPDFGNWSSDGGLTVTESLLASHQDIDAVFCENDAMCLGAQRAIKDAGRDKDIVLAGVDGQAEALKAISDGTNYLVTGLNDADQIGSLGLDRTIDILGGKKTEKDTVVPSPRVTKENADTYYDPDGEF
ncbi:MULTISPECIES: substrate-binding domain-containing protein [unclassified Streptomyces]|uniref:sugar ABC transporter substrate-binding protein n=1 Tax=unclassified Streptomyces TaxID=2593676 RepID=UPI00101B9FC9|nr:substrate-binding domain-containing protein [Streptomyces sp. L-9-10]RYJ25267.1 ribose ABC transport system, periplasmic ribose-binding protein RbsB [Streptomyces sp. L-9-10]